MKSARFREPATVATALGWAAFGVGIALMLGATISFGDWYLIRRPWTDIGLGLIVWGLVVAAIASILLIARRGGVWAMASAAPGIAVTGLFWFFTQAMPLSGACCARPSYPLDPGTMLYSLPILIPALAAATASILAPLAISALLGRGRAQ